MLKRPVNVGFSGGEKKRLETLQMAGLKPQLAVLGGGGSGVAPRRVFQAMSLMSTL